LTAAVVQTWKKPQPTPTGSSTSLCLCIKAIDMNISLTEQLGAVLHLNDTFYMFPDDS